MKKEEFVKKYGITAYKKKMQQGRDWRESHPKEMKTHKDKWAENNPEKVKAHSLEGHRKGSKYYEKHKLSHKEGLQGERERVRGKHHRMWTPFKRIVSPDSQLHHEWIPGTPDYRGAALVEKDQHMQGVIDVIQILEGKITLFTEEDVLRGGEE